MFTTIRTLGLLAAVALLLPLALAQDTKPADKKAPDKKAPPPPPKEKLTPVNGGKPVTLKVNSVNVENRTLNVTNGKENVEIVATQGCWVRFKNPPSAFDDKGNIITKLSPEEEKKAKGDTPEEQKMVGYKADFTSLRPNQIVDVILHRVARPVGGVKTKDAPPPDNRLRVSFILIRQDPD
jgi:hypothetical protein